MRFLLQDATQKHNPQNCQKLNPTGTTATMSEQQETSPPLGRKLPQPTTFPPLFLLRLSIMISTTLKYPLKKLPIRLPQPVNGGDSLQLDLIVSDPSLSQNEPLGQTVTGDAYTNDSNKTKEESEWCELSGERVALATVGAAGEALAGVVGGGGEERDGAVDGREEGGGEGGAGGGRDAGGGGEWLEGHEASGELDAEEDGEEHVDKGGGVHFGAVHRYLWVCLCWGLVSWRLT
ncbi:hypothetical protein BJ508DRAFT_161351 [Ascobolus immersus RN42]|uniref:Uncharacterized protein n=1 Tax=Ascobolus immersus RN42 TaxID=1160509 RepID=A0A3N4HW64_ASCIM|nr:hypothetical protein BJ508DRAFT_161351 [Ascobolus immersus RN42]